MQIDLAKAMQADTTTPPPEMKRALRDPWILVGVRGCASGLLGLWLFASLQTLAGGAIA